MEQLSKDIRQVVEGEPILDFDDHLRETAKKWACYVLQSNTGKELELGLKISQTICDYLNELKEDLI